MVHARTISHLWYFIFGFLCIPVSALSRGRWDAGAAHGDAELDRVVLAIRPSRKPLDS
jgi:hypothetical protein